MYMVAMVMMNDGRRRAEMMEPFVTPMMPPASTARPAAGSSGIPSRASMAYSTPAIAPTPPTERSRLPEMSTMVTAEPTMITLETCMRTLEKFCRLRNLGSMIATTTHITRKIAETARF